MDTVLILFKPDVFQRRIWGRAYVWLQEQTDFTITRMQLFAPGVETDGRLVLHYAEHEGKDFYGRLMEFMRSGHVCAAAGMTTCIPQMRDAVKRFRDSWHSRGAANLLHCSDSPEAGMREAEIWFPSK